MGCVPVFDVGSTWTCVQEERRRCRPRGGGTDPVSASSGPGNDLMPDRHHLDLFCFNT